MKRVSEYLFVGICALFFGCSNPVADEKSEHRFVSDTNDVSCIDHVLQEHQFVIENNTIIRYFKDFDRNKLQGINEVDSANLSFPFIRAYFRNDTLYRYEAHRQCKSVVAQDYFYLNGFPCYIEKNPLPLYYDYYILSINRGDSSIGYLIHDYPIETKTTLEVVFISRRNYTIEILFPQPKFPSISAEEIIHGVIPLRNVSKISFSITTERKYFGGTLLTTISRYTRFHGDGSISRKSNPIITQRYIYGKYTKFWFELFGPAVSEKLCEKQLKDISYQ
ncbi:MAG: hypothetical protein KKD31_17245 [Bacteroidetes bacterium]|nr:hypothetical protein [Bacteroidota bacterium]